MKAKEVKLKYSRGQSYGKITCSYDALEIFRKFIGDALDHHEEFAVLVLSRANEVLGIYRLSMGGLTGMVVDMRHLMQVLILANASSFIVCHNHPSGNLTPSDADINVTKKMFECAKLFDIKLLDHLIITSSGRMSFADEGLL